jgi:hypothetical protein
LKADSFTSFETRTMGNEMIAYLQQLEILAFFSGYPIIYALVAFIKGNRKATSETRGKLFRLLPFMYTTVGALYLGLQLRKFYPDYTFTRIAAEIQIPFLTAWGLLSLLFWIPVLNKRPAISLLHSLVFFFVIVKNFYFQISGSVPDNDVMKNYMRVYSDSIILNTGILISFLIIYLMIRLIKKRTIPAK